MSRARKGRPGTVAAITPMTIAIPVGNPTPKLRERKYRILPERGAGGRRKRGASFAIYDTTHRTHRRVQPGTAEYDAVLRAATAKIEAEQQRALEAEAHKNRAAEMAAHIAGGTQ